MALVPFRVSGAAADQGAEERLFVVSTAASAAASKNWAWWNACTQYACRHAKRRQACCHVMAPQPLQTRHRRMQKLRNTTCCCLLQIAGDSITIRQRPAAAQAMRDQALRSVLQVAFTSKIISAHIYRIAQTICVTVTGCGASCHVPECSCTLSAAMPCW
jgi:hypothetical protein